MITSDLKVPGTFCVIEAEDGKFLVRDPYGKIECKRDSKEAAQRVVDAANKAMRDYNNGVRIYHGGDI
ncbi:MAG: hypothetical protein IIZ69_13775 [Pseudomonas sp.]|nr:hypothetical protein [Pseudomonas sp.]